MLHDMLLFKCVSILVCTKVSNALVGNKVWHSARLSCINRKIYNSIISGSVLNYGNFKEDVFDVFDDEEYIVDRRRDGKWNSIKEIDIEDEEDIINSMRFDDMDYDEYDDEYDDNGDYWYNPTSGFDNEYYTKSKKQWVQERRRPKKSSFRYGKPSGPKLLRDFYNKFFWYGMNMSDEEDEGGRVIFGGTRGKFNGLDLFQSVSDKKVRKPRVPSSHNDKPRKSAKNKNLSIVLSNTGPVSKPTNPLKNEVNSWFQESNDTSEENLKSSLDNILDTLFLVDTQERQQMEDLYNKNMKLGKYRKDETTKYRHDGILPVADYAIIPQENTTSVDTVQINTPLEKLNQIKQDIKYLFSKLNHHNYIKQSIHYRIQDANEELSMLNNDIQYLKQQLLNEKRREQMIRKELHGLNLQMEDTSRFLRYEMSKLNMEEDLIHDIQLDYDDLVLYCLDDFLDGDEVGKEEFLKWVYALENDDELV